MQKYSVEDIDRMRRALSSPLISDATTEDRLRTYMQNGTTAAELIEWCDREARKKSDPQRSIQEMYGDQLRQRDYFQANTLSNIVRGFAG